MLKKRTLNIVLLIALSAAALWAAGSKEGAEESQALTLRVLSVYTPDHAVGPAVEQINQLFAETHPDVTIEMQTMGADDLKQVLRTDFDSGNPPAVFNFWADNSNLDFIEAGRWLDLSGVLAADPAWKDNFLPGALGVHGYDTSGVWGLPQASFVLGMYYNKDLFVKAGISNPPETMEELYMDIDKLKALDGITPWPIGNMDGWRSVHLFASLFYKINGTDAATLAAERKIRHDGPEVVNTYKAMQDLVESGAFGDQYTGLGYADEIALFNEGKSAIRFSGSWTLGEIDGVDTGFFPFPYFKELPQFEGDWFAGFADSWGIASDMDPALEAAAVDYVKLWTGPEGSRIFAEEAKNIPAANADVDPEKTGDLFATVVSSMSSITNSEVDFATPERSKLVADQVGANAQAVLAMEMTPEEAAKKLQQVVDSE